MQEKRETKLLEGRKACCNICGSDRFVDMPELPTSVFTRKGIMCSGCGSLERHRIEHELIVQSGWFGRRARVLHLAPEACLAQALHARFGEGYEAADLDPERYPATPVAKLDLCRDLDRLEAQTYDLIIHNHVLEHLPCDYRSVLAGLHAKLRPGGLHLFTVPFMRGRFREDTDADDPADRLRRFGQTDHYRVFSPTDIGRTIGSVVDIPPEYDLTSEIAPERLGEIGIPEGARLGWNNNSVFRVTRADGDQARAGARSKTHRRVAAAVRPGLGGVLFVTANGVGRGHLSRQMAVASALRQMQPMFLTMSLAARAVAGAGWPVVYVPHHDHIGQEAGAWEKGLSRELALAMRAANARTLVYDVNYVFGGVKDFLAGNPDIRSIWIRRAMWPDHHEHYLAAGKHFTDIIEPADLAEADDLGPTVTSPLRGSARKVSPIVILDPDHRANREAARRKLGLRDDANALLLNLTGSNQQAFDPVRNVLLDILAGRPDWFVVELRSSLGQDNRKPVFANHRIAVLDDAYRYSRAFDAAVCRAGCNSFHENLFANLPTLFVPNEERDLDLQTVRARWAARNGLALASYLSSSSQALATALSTLLQEDSRENIRETLGAFHAHSSVKPTGARELAQIVES